MAFQSILCAIDFSDHSAQALRCAAAIADRQQAPLQVVSVIDPLLPAAVAVAYNTESLSDETATELRTFATATLGVRPAVSDVSIHVAVGQAAREILRCAQTIRADLIVLGTHGLGGLRRLLLGSTTHRVLRESGSAVLAVPLPDHADHQPFTRHAPIVVGVSLERTRRAHVDCAVALAQDFQASVVLAHVVTPIQTGQPWQRRADEAQPIRRDRARAALDALSAEVGHDLEVRAVVETGEPASVLTKIAGDENAGLIVVGLGNPGSIGRRPGITAYRVVAASDVPVLAVPESE
jgi:nucleotide-binding universal stress UspA family protein